MCLTMYYPIWHLPIAPNYKLVWLYFNKFYWGLLLGIELAFVSILIGALIAFGIAGRSVRGTAGRARFRRSRLVVKTAFSIRLR